jgi:hypothetical protein
MPEGRLPEFNRVGHGLRDNVPKKLPETFPQSMYRHPSRHLARP